jgi:hypothetical protein
MNPRPMVVGWPRCDRSCYQLIAFSLRTHTVAVRHKGKERAMLNAALGMLAMVPVVFGFAGYAMVSR